MAILINFKLAILLVTHKFARRGFLPLLVFAFLWTSSSYAGVKESLEKKFPKCSFEQKTIFPNTKELTKLRNLYSSKSVSSFYSYYLRSCGKKTDMVFVLSDLIRTHKQFVLVAIKNSRLNEIDVLKFDEPNEYKASKNWLSRFHEAKLKDSRLESEVDAISGATLTAKSTSFIAWLALSLESIIKRNGKI